MYLLELPNRRSKHNWYNKANQKVLNALIEKKADTDSVELENKSALDKFREELKQLRKNK
jgi:hypothetical protein